MARNQSDLEILLKTLRRIIVLAVAAISLMRGMPLIALAIRVAILWAVLYISSGIIDVVFRRLSAKATMIVQGNEGPINAEPPQTAVTKE